jgi:hypothetical protein
MEFFCTGLRLERVVPAFVVVPGCWVQMPLNPGAPGPYGGPMPVDVLPVPALPCAWALLIARSVATTTVALIVLLVHMLEILRVRPQLASLIDD